MNKNTLERDFKALHLKEAKAWVAKLIELGHSEQSDQLISARKSLKSCREANPVELASKRDFSWTLFQSATRVQAKLGIRVEGMQTNAIFFRLPEGGDQRFSLRLGSYDAWGECIDSYRKKVAQDEAKAEYRFAKLRQELETHKVATQMAEKNISGEVSPGVYVLKGTGRQTNHRQDSGPGISQETWEIDLTDGLPFGESLKVSSNHRNMYGNYSQMRKGNKILMFHLGIESLVWHGDAEPGYPENPVPKGGVACLNRPWQFSSSKTGKKVPVSVIVYIPKEWKNLWNSFEGVRRATMPRRGNTPYLLY